VAFPEPHFVSLISFEVCATVSDKVEIKMGMEVGENGSLLNPRPATLEIDNNDIPQSGVYSWKPSGPKADHESRFVLFEIKSNASAKCLNSIKVFGKPKT
jgi:hypothetical protein